MNAASQAKERKAEVMGRQGPFGSSASLVSGAAARALGNAYCSLS